MLEAPCGHRVDEVVYNLYFTFEFNNEIGQPAPDRDRLSARSAEAALARQFHGVFHFTLQTSSGIINSKRKVPPQ